MHHLLMDRLKFMLAIVLAGTFVIGAWAAPATQDLTPNQAATGTGRLFLLHAAPFDAVLDQTAVTIVASQGTGASAERVLLAQGAKFGDSAGYVNLPAGTYTVSIYPGSLTLEQTLAVAALFEAPVTLAAGQDLSLAAIGTSPLPTAPFPVTVLPLVDNTDPPAADQAKLRVVHVAPFAGTVDATAVDIVPDAGGDALVSNLKYGQDTGFVSVPAGTYDLQVVLAGTSTVAIQLDPVTLEAGEIVTVYATGGANSYDPGPVFFKASARGQAQVRLIHAAPFAPVTATASIVLDPLFNESGTKSFIGVNFGQNSFYTALTPGFYQARVYAGTDITGTPVLTGSLTIGDNDRTSVLVIGGNREIFPLALLPLNDRPASLPGANEALVRIVHAAPFTNTLEGTGVDVLVGPTVLSTDLRYAQNTGYETVPSATDIPVTVRLASDPTAVIFNPTLNQPEGSVTTVIAVGDGPNQNVRLLILDDLQVTQMVYLPIVMRP
jgi:hypothetical protein